MMHLPSGGTPCQDTKEPELESRVDELEAKLCLAEDMLDELNRTVFRQQEQIEQLQQQLRLLWRQQQDAALAASAERRDLREDIPPHY